MTDDAVVDLAFSRYRTSTGSEVTAPPADAVRRTAFRRQRRRTAAASCLAVAATAVSVMVVLRGPGDVPTAATRIPSGSPSRSTTVGYDYKITGPTTLQMMFDGTRYVGTIQLVGHNVGGKATSSTRLGLRLPGGIQLISTPTEQNFDACASWDACWSPGIPAGGGQVVYTIKLAASYPRQTTTHSIGQMTLEIHATADGNRNEPDITPDDNSITVDLVAAAG